MSDFLNKNCDYLNFYMIKKRFCGDSNVKHTKDFGIIDSKFLCPMPGQSIRHQIDIINDFDLSDVDTVIFWNGFNIKYFIDSKDYITAYEDLMNVIRIEHPNIKFYICSLLPASKEKLEKDIAEGSPHNIYLAEEYDRALEQHFGDRYIDIKFLKKDNEYNDDGYHLSLSYHRKMIPYVILKVYRDQM